MVNTEQGRANATALQQLHSSNGSTPPTD